MSGGDLSNRIVAALSSGGSSTTNVKKLRKQILLQMQTDSDDKEAKEKLQKNSTKNLKQMAY
jgi:hypothetical protein